jgi:DnaK suppressor protein
MDAICNKGYIKMKPAFSTLDIAFFKELLQQELEDLLTRADETVSILSKSDEKISDPLDRAAVDTGRESALRFRERESRLIRKIKTALRKIDEETFGICESCGEDIPMPRLKARPVTAHCIRCKTKMENWERAAGL